MNKTLAARTSIYNWFQSSKSAQSYFTQAAQADAYAAYYTSMYLIQDSAEAVSNVCAGGFSSDALRAYTELWGTLQALAIQQDAVAELNMNITGQHLSKQRPAAWQQIRTLRHELAGHPVAQGQSATKRSFLGRTFGSLEKLQYEQFQSTANGQRQLSINLRQLIDDYDTEVAQILDDILKHMKSTWP